MTGSHRPGTTLPAPHFRQLDGLRALAVTAVLWQHTGRGPLLRIGREGIGVYGVWLFFVLSGFLITGILLRARDRTGGTGVRPALRTFYIRRFLRIFPAYYIAVAVAIALSYGRVRPLSGWYATYLLNWYIFANGWVGPGSHIWSLCIEEQFYLCWPLLVLAAPRRLLPYLFGSLLILAPLARYAVLMYTGDSVSVLVATPSNLDALGLGAILAWIRHSGVLDPSSLTRVCRTAGGIGVLMLVAMFGQQGLHLRIPFVPSPNVLENVFEATAASLVSVYAVNGAVNTFGGWGGRLLDSGASQYLGRISYGMYLYHGFVMAAVSRLLGEQLGYKRFALVYLASVAVATVSWFVMERPINSLKDRLSSPSRPPDAASHLGPVLG